MTDRQHILTAAIITYNHQDTIARCIESVLSQKTSYPFKIELWDDCSTDKTSRICAEYAERHPGKVVHIRQEKNTFMDFINNSGCYKNYGAIKTKYFYVIEGDDYLLDDNFFESGISYLENNDGCSIYATRVRCNNELTHKSYDWPEMQGDDFVVTIDDVGTKRYRFVMIQGRIYRNSERPDFFPLDAAIYFYHLTQGYCKCFNRVSAVYNYNGKGIWSELDDNMQYRINQSLFYRMIQYYGFKHEKQWLRGLCRKERRKVKVLKFFLGRKRAWALWFRRFMVPTFGEECLEKYWNYVTFTRKNRNAKV